MIVMLAPHGKVGLPPWQNDRQPELWHRPEILLPGGHLDAVLQQKREHHLHAFLIERRANCTVTLQAPEHLALWLLDADLRRLDGPAMVLQRVLDPGPYWAHVGAVGGARSSSGPYRLRLHCVDL